VNRRETLAEICTMKERDRWSKRILECYGNELVTFRLKGVLFFGNCVSLKLELNSLFDEDQKDEEGLPVDPPKFVLVDFSEVVYVDTSVWEILHMVSRRAMSVSATEVHLCGMDDNLAGELQEEGHTLLPGSRSELNLEHVLHSYLLALEDRILRFSSSGHPPVVDGWDQLVAWIAAATPKQEAPQSADTLKKRLQLYFQEKSHREGNMVQKEGHECTALRFVVSGEFHVFAQARSRRTTADRTRNTAMIFRKLTSGCIVGTEVVCGNDLVEEAQKGVPSQTAEGEDASKSAHSSLQCKHAGQVLMLTRESFARLRSEDPQLCIALLQAVATVRENELWRFTRYRYEPEEVEVENGIRRQFTIGSEEVLRKRSRHLSTTLPG